MKGMWLRIRRLLGWSSAERDIEDELRFHVDMEAAQYERQGMDAREARRRALVAFGGQEHWREETRRTRDTGWLEDVVRDVRFAVRGLLHSPTFAIAALMTITLGVGATTAVFSAVHRIVLAPLPFPDSDELVTVWMRNPAQGIEEDITSWPNFADWREATTALEHMATVRDARFALTGIGDPEEVFGAVVSRGFFEMIGAPLALGRSFRAEETEVEGPPVRAVVLSHELFTRRFAADPSLIGRTIQLNEVAYEVIGVTAPGLRYPRSAELWTPHAFPSSALREARGALWLPVIGRLAEGVDLRSAQNEMDAVARRLEEAYPDVNEGVGIKLEPLRDTLVGDVRTPLLVLLGAVALVLLIAVVNVANLLLARGTSRVRELALRLTLGAGRGRIVRQVLAESLVLGGAGGLVGAALASLAVGALVAAGPTDIPRLDEVGVDGWMLAFALVVSVGASVLFGLVPAFHASRVDPGTQLREGARGTSAAALARLRGVFVVGQFGLALMLLVGAGLLTRSFMNLRALDPGFDTENVLNVTLSLPPARYPEPAAAQGFYDELLGAIRAVPGVAEAGSVSTFFLNALPNMGGISVEGRAELADQTRRFPVVRDAASPGFFAAAGMEILVGRGFGPEDGPDDRRVAVVNETFARVFLAGRDPIGQRFIWGSESGDDTPWIAVIGVVRDARRSGLDQEIRPSGFVPLAQFAEYRMDVLVRASSDPLVLVPDVRRVIRSLDPQLPLTRLSTLDRMLAEALSQRRFVATVLVAFAGSALALAAIGIFGMMAYLVGQRRREIGIRVALGAHPSEVLRRVFTEGLVHAGVGLGIGALAALGLTRLVSSQLYGLAPSDPITFLGAAAVLLSTAMLACLIPARRAARVDPMVALREE